MDETPRRRGTLGDGRAAAAAGERERDDECDDERDLGGEGAAGRPRPFAWAVPVAAGAVGRSAAADRARFFRCGLSDSA
jgi:hypothetical protein